MTGGRAGPQPGMETVQSCFQGKRSEIGKVKQKSPTHLEAHERQRRVLTSQTDLPPRVNHLTGKNTGLTQLEQALIVPAGVLAWCGPCHSPQTLLPSCLLTVGKQEVMLINKTAWDHTQGNVTSLPLQGLGRGAKIKGKLLDRVRGKARTLKNQLTSDIDIGPYSDRYLPK